MLIVTESKYVKNMVFVVEMYDSIIENRHGNNNTCDSVFEMRDSVLKYAIH